MAYRQGMIHQYGFGLSIIHRTLDALIIFLALFLCAKAYGVTISSHYQLAGFVAISGFLFFAEWHALYSSWRVDSVKDEIWRIISIWSLTFFVLLALAFISKSSIQFSRVTIIVWGLTTPVALVLERMILRYSLRRIRKVGKNSRTVAIAGGGKVGARLEEIIDNSPWMGLRIHGIYGDETVVSDSNMTKRTCQKIEMLLQAVHDREVDCVYITYPMQQEEKIRHLVECLSDSTASVHVVPDVFVSDLFKARWSRLGEVPLVSVYESPIYGISVLLKRLEDIILGSLILLMISPLMILIALAVKLTSSGPIIFKQRRYGLNGQIIEVWKFRSMSVTEDGGHVPQAQRNDPRITPLGSFLRKTSLDELPQFINVLQGRMSIVGPRPHAVAHNEQYRKLIHGYMLRHKVKPGITGWAQVNGWRGETETVDKMEMRVQFDLEYINNWSVWLDIKIIAMTIFGGMRGKNAY